MSFREPVLLGRTGLRVSRLGISGGNGVPDHAIEKAFHEHGINYFYWGVLRRRGMKKAIQNLARAHRDQLVIALQSFDRTGLLMKPFCQRGLKALGIEYADVLILGGHNHFPSQRVLEDARQLKEQGKVRFLALSSHHRPLFRDLAQRGAASPIDIFMVRYNAAHRGAEQEVFSYLHEDNGPGVTCYTATRWGQLLQARRMPPGERPLTAAECYRFVLSNPYVDICLTGPANAQQLEEALITLDDGPLGPEEMARVRRIGDHLHG